MTSIRRFECNDLFQFNNVNLDSLTETYTLPYYMHYMCRWPGLFVKSSSPPSSSSLSSTTNNSNNNITGYICGKAEGNDDNYHGHVTAVTVAAEYRRLRLAKTFMDYLETVSDEIYHAYFVDLYVRCSNAVAIKMYELFGYIPYRRVKGYYSGEEDAFDMRKALSSDKDKKSIIPHEPFLVEPGEND